MQGAELRFVFLNGYYARELTSVDLDCHRICTLACLPRYMPPAFVRHGWMAPRAQAVWRIEAAPCTNASSTALPWPWSHSNSAARAPLEQRQLVAVIVSQAAQHLRRRGSGRPDVMHRAAFPCASLLAGPAPSLCSRARTGMLLRMHVVPHMIAQGVCRPLLVGRQAGSRQALKSSRGFLQ